MVAEHLATVAAALQSLQEANGSDAAHSSQQAWRWVGRRNKAAAYPTDFGLLACNPAVVDALKVRAESRAVLSTHATDTDVHLDDDALRIQYAQLSSK